MRINERAYDRNCPGVISQFEILDHKFYQLYDPLLQKNYTNQLLFDTEDTILFSHKCWEFLSSRYGGFPVERFSILNISNIVET